MEQLELSVLLTIVTLIFVAIVAFSLIILFKDRIVNSWRRRMHKRKNKDVNIDLS